MSVFSKTQGLADMIRGMRAARSRDGADGEGKYIVAALEECRSDLSSSSGDLSVKATTIKKLQFLHMIGYDVAWANFYMIEVMSATKFSYKRIGYAAAAQCFRPDTDVLMLATNLIKKDLKSSHVFEVAVALTGLSYFITGDLAQDLAGDVASLLKHSSAIIRRKAILLLYKVFLQCPAVLPHYFPKIKESLQDKDPKVVGSAVGVVCELARKNPKNYLPLAPPLFRLLETTGDNWTLIKLVKLFGVLTPLEPRLAKKLDKPMSHLINTTDALSLLYECIKTVTIGMSQNTALLTTCLAKLKTFLENDDQNLKYIALLGLGHVLDVQPTLAQHSVGQAVFDCLHDQDVSIRMRALDVSANMVNENTLPDVVKILLTQLETMDTSASPDTSIANTQYKNFVVRRILAICGSGRYANVRHFEWYFGVLCRLAQLRGVACGGVLSEQMIDIAMRVRSVRSYACRIMSRLIMTPVSVYEQGVHDHSLVLNAASFIVGEYGGELLDDRDIMLKMLDTSTLLSLPENVQCSYIHNILKIFVRHATRCLQDDPKDDSEDCAGSGGLTSLCDVLVMRTSQLMTHSIDMEAHERVILLATLLRHIRDADHTRRPYLLQEYALFFEPDLTPVAEDAQQRVPIPDGLDLDSPMTDRPTMTLEPFRWGSIEEHEEEAMADVTRALETIPVIALTEEDFKTYKKKHKKKERHGNEKHRKRRKDRKGKGKDDNTKVKDANTEVEQDGSTKDEDKTAEASVESTKEKRQKRKREKKRDPTRQRKSKPVRPLPPQKVPPSRLLHVPIDLDLIPDALPTPTGTSIDRGTGDRPPQKNSMDNKDNAIEQATTSLSNLSVTPCSN